MSGVVSQVCCPPYFMRQGFLLDLEPTNRIRLKVKQPAGSSASSALELQTQTTSPGFWPGRRESKLGSSRLLCKHFAN